VPVIFLNADLDILSHQNVQPLIDEIGNRACLLASGPSSENNTCFARYELSLIPTGPFTMGRTSGDTDTNAPP
jgi:hypothetical protein